MSALQFILKSRPNLANILFSNDLYIQSPDQQATHDKFDEQIEPTVFADVVYRTFAAFEMVFYPCFELTQWKEMSRWINDEMSKYLNEFWMNESFSFRLSDSFIQNSKFIHWHLLILSFIHLLIQKNGGEYRSRTGDLLHAMQAL